MAGASARAEDIAVTAPRLASIGHYRDVARYYRRFDAIPPTDRGALTFGIAAMIEPGHRPIQDAAPRLATGNDAVPLFGPTGDEMTLPRDPSLWTDDPRVMAPVGPDDRIVLRFVFHVAMPATRSFTGAMARGWLASFDASTENVIGAVFAFLAPDAHRLIVVVPPSSRLTVRTGDRDRLLVDNGGIAAYRFMLRPRDYPADATFSCTRPITRIDLVPPMDMTAQWRRDR